MSNLKNWVLAALPKTLPVSMAPVILGYAIAYSHHCFNIFPAFLCMIFAVLAQITSNLINDYYDFKKGADREDRLGPLRTVSAGLITPKKMMHAIIITICVAMLSGIMLIHFGGWQLIFVGLLVGIFAYAYSGGPYPLSYKGLGDLAVIVFYGIVPVMFTYYVQGLSFPFVAWILSLGIGLTGLNLLIVNNYRDMEADIISGKKTTVVRFGRKTMRSVYIINCIIAAIIACFALKIFSFVIIPFVIFSFMLWKKLGKLKGRELNKLLGMTSMNVLLYSLLISLTLIIVR